MRGGLLLALGAPLLSMVMASEASGAEAAVRKSKKKAAEVDAGPRPVKFNKRWLDPYFRSAGGALKQGLEKYRTEDWDEASAKLTRAASAMPRGAPERGPARYLLAMSRANAGQWEAAGKLFEELHRSYALLAPYHAYHAARCRLRRGDTAGAIEWASKVPEKTVPEAEAVLIKIDALVSEKRWAEVEQETARFLEKFPAGPRRAEATFRRAESLENLKRPAMEAAGLYRRIWAEAPGEAWSSRAAERLDALAAAATNAAEATQLKTRTAAEWMTRGMVLFDRNANTSSEAAFASALGAPGLDKAIECRARYHRAQSVWKQRDRRRAAPLFVEAEGPCRAAGDADLIVKSLYQGARCLSTAGDKAGATARYAKIEAEFPTHSYADDARLRAAEVAVDVGDEAKAEALLKEIPTRYPQGDLLGESLWRLAFRAWRAQQWEQARKLLDENLRRIPREEIWYAEGRAHYWKGRIYEKEGNGPEARAAYARAVREYPLSVYALLSMERLRRSFPAERAALLKELHGPLKREKTPPAASAIWSFPPRPVFGEPGFLRAVELARMGLGNEARRELARLGFVAPDKMEAAKLRSSGAVGNAAAPAVSDGGGEIDEAKGREDIYWITAILLDRGRLWSASHSIPRHTLTEYRLAYPTGGRRAAEWRIAYPRAFPELVAKNSKLNKVPEALQLAIMREESAFNPRIESFANALGLTQMLVRTAQRFVNPKQKITVTEGTLLDPARNLEYGSKFLSFLYERFGRSAPLTIAGYNAGEGAVDRWLREKGDLELDELMESIPYDETRNYTKRVLASFTAYTWLYFPANPVPEISFAIDPAAPKRAGRPSSRATRRRGR